MSSRVIGIIPSIQKEAHAIQCVTIFSSSASGARERASDADERARANARSGDRRLLTKKKGAGGGVAHLLLEKLRGHRQSRLLRRLVLDALHHQRRVHQHAERDLVLLLTNPAESRSATKTTTTTTTTRLGNQAREGKPKAAETSGTLSSTARNHSNHNMSRRFSECR